MDSCGTCVRHEEVRHQKQGAEKSVIVVSPTERTTIVEIRHFHARQGEIRHGVSIIVLKNKTWDR